MAFPVVESTATSSTSTAGTNHVVVLPSGIAAGDLILILMDIGSTAASLNAHGSYTELLDENQANGLKILYRQATGGETNPTFVSSASTRDATITLRISGAEDPATQPPQIGTTATATNSSPNPPSLTPTGGAKDYLWIAMMGSPGEQADDGTYLVSVPAPYAGNSLQKTCGVAGTNLGGLIAAAWRTANAASEDPGVFGVSENAAWRAQTIAVHPAAGTAHDPGTRADNLDITDSVDVSIGRGVLPADGVGVTDSTAQEIGRGVVVNDALAISDAGLEAEVLADGPAVYLPLTDPSGSVAEDISGNNRDGTVSGAVLGSTPLLPGDSGSALFDQNDDYIEVSFDFQDDGTVRTLEGWAYRDSTAEWNYLVRLLGNPGGRIHSPASGSDFVFEPKFSFGMATWAGVVPTAQVFYWVLEFDETNDLAELWIDNVSQGTRALATTWSDGSGFRLGADGAESWGGRQGHFAVYLGALSAARRGAHYAAGTSGAGFSTLSAIVRQIDDALGATDANTPSLGLTRAQDDAAGITDSSAQNLGKEVNPADALGVTDAQTFDRGLMQADALGVTDAVALAQAKQLADALGLTDAATTAVAFAASVADPLGITDSAEAAIVLLQPVDDALGVTDAVRLDRAVALADALGLTDATALAQNKNLEDALGITDAAATTSSIVASVADALGITDAQVIGRGRELADALGITDGLVIDFVPGGAGFLPDILEPTFLLIADPGFIAGILDAEHMAEIEDKPHTAELEDPGFEGQEHG